MTRGVTKKAPGWPGGIHNCSLRFSLSSLVGNHLLAATVVLVAIDLARFAILLAVDLLLFLRGQFAAIGTRSLRTSLVILASFFSRCAASPAVNCPLFTP